MTSGQLTINGKDAFNEWGLSMDSAALSALMTPAGMKDNIKTKTRTKHGETVSKGNAKMEARKVTIVFQICANSEVQFFGRYLSFCEELKTGFLEVETSFQPNVVYRFEYNECSQFTQFMRGIAKFTLKLTESDPSNRTKYQTTEGQDHIIG